MGMRKKKKTPTRRRTTGGNSKRQQSANSSQTTGTSSIETYANAINALGRCIQHYVCDSRRHVVLLIDSNNVRGADHFKWTNEDLLQKITDIKNSRPMFQSNLHPVFMMDHGRQAQAFCNPSAAFIFAGLHRTADDTIVQTSRWFLGQDLVKSKDVTVVVVTADGELRLRCRRQGVQLIFSSREFVDWIKHYITVLTIHGAGKGRQVPAGDAIQNNAEPATNDNHTESVHEATDSQTLSAVMRSVGNVEYDLRQFDYLQPPWRSPHEKESAMKQVPWESVAFESDYSPPSTTVPRAFPELTWHRIVVAECLRCVLSSRFQQQPPSQHAATAVGTDKNANVDADVTETMSTNTNTRAHADVRTATCAGLIAEYCQKVSSNIHRPKSDTDSLCFDHRIRSHGSMQRQLINYIIQSIGNPPTLTSATATGAGTNIAEATRDIHPELTEPIRRPIHDAAAYIRHLIQSTPQLSRHEILELYMKSGPPHIKFERKKTLEELFNANVIRHANPGQASKQERQARQEGHHWELRPSPCIIDVYVFARRTRRAERMELINGTFELPVQLPLTDEALDDASSVEKTWMDCLTEAHSNAFES